MQVHDNEEVRVESDSARRGRFLEGRQVQEEETAGEGSSSPYRLFTSSPGRAYAMSSTSHSRSSSNASAKGHRSSREQNLGKRRTVLSSDDESSSEEEEGDGNDDDATFLANFRARQAASAVKLVQDSPITDNLSSQRGIADASSAFSGSLSEPPSVNDNNHTTSLRSTQDTPLSIANLAGDTDDSDDNGRLHSPSPRKRFSRKSLLPTTSLDSEESTCLSQDLSEIYKSEVQKLSEAALKKQDRARKLKRLAARSRNVREEKDSSQINVPEDEISSASDDDLESASSTHKHVTKSNKGRSQAVLQMNSGSGSDSDLSDLKTGIARPSTVASKQLSKKDADEMVRVQARIEREKRTAVARSAHMPRKVGTFSINDLLANIGATEASRSIADAGTVACIEGSPSSDPIQSSSSEGEGEASRSKVEKSIHANERNGKPFHIRIREQSGERAFRDGGTLVGDKAAQQKYDLLQEAKRLAMSNVAEEAVLLLATGANDDGIELFSASSDAPRADVDDESGDETITASQVQRAGRLFKSLQKESQSDTTVDERSAHQQIKSRKHIAPPAHNARRALNDLIFKRIEEQNLEIRRKREELHGKRSLPPQESNGEDAGNIGTLLKALREEAEAEAHPLDDEEGNDSDFRPEVGSESEDVQDDSDDEHERPDAADQLEVPGSEFEHREAPSAPPSPVHIAVRRKKGNKVLLDEDEELDEKRQSIPESPGALEPFGGADLAEFFAATPEPDGQDESVTIDGDLGQFFQDTQTDAPLRGESFAVLPLKTGDFPSTSNLMPPPTTSAKGLSLVHGSDYDGFAALRRAQANEALVLDNDPEDLPALEDILQPQDEEDLIALELEAIRAEVEQRQAQQMREAAANEVTYINKDGFFTQTRPDSFSYSFTQSQSQDILGATQEDKDDALQHVDVLDIPHSITVETAQKPKKRRFRRAASTSSDKEDANGLLEANTEDREVYDQEEEADVPVAEGHHAGQTQRSAFELMKMAAIDRAFKRQEENERAAKQFVHGEAEESDDDSDVDGVRERSKHGGLGGVFSDEERASAEDDESDEDDGADLEGLIDEERDADEAEKDVLARERYQQDMDADEKAALALHERATKGAFRTKRRARNNQDGNLEDFLDEDYEDDWLEKVARNPYGNIIKKRKLAGKDGMDLLSEREDSIAFVREYRESHQDSIDINESYSFLLEADEEEEESQGVVLNKVVEDDEQEGESQNESEQPRTISRQEIQEAIANRRRARKLRATARALDDEADREEEQRRLTEEKQREEALRRNIEKALYDPDEDDLELSAVKLNDRITKRDTISAALHANASDNVALSDDDEGEAPARFGSVLNMRRVSTSERERERMARLAQEYANEPDWRSAKEAIARTRHAAVKTASANRTSSMATSLPPRQTGAVRSRLRNVLSRQSQFSESQ